MQCVALIKYNLCVRENSVCLHVHVCLYVPEFWHFLHGVTVCHPCKLLDFTQVSLISSGTVVQ